MFAIGGVSAGRFLIGVEPLDAGILPDGNGIDGWYGLLFSFRRHTSHGNNNNNSQPSRSVKTSLSFLTSMYNIFERESFACKKLQQLSYQMEKFNKVLDIYRSKYPMEMNAFLKFMHERIDLPDATLTAVQKYILNGRKKSDRISQEELKLFFHVVAAAQSKVDFASKQMSSLTNYLKLGKFKSKQKKEDKQEITGNEKVEATVEVKPVVKEEVKVVQTKPIQKKEVKIQKSNVPTVQIPPKKVEISYEKVERQVKPAKEIESRSPKKQKKEPILPVIQQDIIDENRTTNSGTFSKTEEFLLNNPNIQMMKIDSKKSVQITGYDKFGQNYLNPIIKYRIVSGNSAVYRRYTEFQNLMSYLQRNYEGFILPELPPKEGIKSGFSYFWGIDEAFLNDRQLKLEEMLNALLVSRYISQDEILDKFLKDQDFEVEDKGQGKGFGYLKSIGSIAFNAQALKSYGLAYYKYLTEFKKTDITTPVTIKYKEIEALLAYFLQIDRYRTAINGNFERRREISHQLDCSRKDRHLTITDFDKLTASTAADIRNLNKEFEKYMGLKSQESWLNYLIGQKQLESQSDTDELKREREDTVKRIRRMEDNLLESIDTLRLDKQNQLEELGAHMMNWRRKIHP